MTQIRFCLDEDAMRNSFIKALQDAGLDVTTVADAKRLGYSDAEQLAWATQQGRVLYTFNVKDFNRLHCECLAQDKHHTGIVAVPHQRYSVGEQLRGLMRLTQSLTAEEMVNQIVYLGQYLKL